MCSALLNNRIQYFVPLIWDRVYVAQAGLKLCNQVQPSPPDLLISSPLVRTKEIDSPWEGQGSFHEDTDEGGGQGKTKMAGNGTHGWEAGQATDRVRTAQNLPSLVLGLLIQTPGLHATYLGENRRNRRALHLVYTGLRQSFLS